jgi:hypothetical protein
MWAIAAPVTSPRFDLSFGIGQRQEPVLVQALDSEFAVDLQPTVLGRSESLDENL